VIRKGIMIPMYLILNHEPAVIWLTVERNILTKPHLVRIYSSKIIPCPLEVLLRFILLSDNPKRAISCKSHSFQLK
jgi:hypothetical protein